MHQACPGDNEALLQLHAESRVGSLVGQAVVGDVALLFRPAVGDRTREGDELWSRV